MKVQKEIECKKADRCRLAENCPYEYYPLVYYACFDNKRVNYDYYKEKSKEQQLKHSEENKEKRKNEYEKTKYSNTHQNRKFKFCK